MVPVGWLLRRHGSATHNRIMLSPRPLLLLSLRSNRGVAFHLSLRCACCGVGTLPAHTPSHSTFWGRRRLSK